MSFIRGIFSTGIIIGCMLNWFEIETQFGLLALSGLTWWPVTVLLYASVLTAGYAFYNSTRKSNQNSWIYLTSGIYGLGTSIYIYLSVRGNFEYINLLLDTELTNSFIINNGFGLYLTGIFSFFLFLFGFNKSDKKQHVSNQTIEQQKNYSTNKINYRNEELGRTYKPNLQDWLKENPGKSINDYYSNYK